MSGSAPRQTSAPSLHQNSRGWRIWACRGSKRQLAPIPTRPGWGRLGFAFPSRRHHRQNNDESRRAVILELSEGRRRGIGGTWESFRRVECANESRLGPTPLGTRRLRRDPPDFGDLAGEPPGPRSSRPQDRRDHRARGPGDTQAQAPSEPGRTCGGTGSRTGGPCREGTPKQQPQGRGLIPPCRRSKACSCVAYARGSSGRLGAGPGRSRRARGLGCAWGHVQAPRERAGGSEGRGDGQRGANGGGRSRRDRREAGGSEIAPASPSAPSRLRLKSPTRASASWR